MEKELSNSVSVTGAYNDIPTSITSLVSIVTMIDGLKVTKEANKKVWADGILTYTITVINNTEKTYVKPVVSDTLDVSLVELVKDSVIVNGSSSTYQFDEGTGVLTISLDDIDASTSKTIEFEVKKK